MCLHPSKEGTLEHFQEFHKKQTFLNFMGVYQTGCFLYMGSQGGQNFFSQGRKGGEAYPGKKRRGDTNLSSKGATNIFFQWGAKRFQQNFTGHKISLFSREVCSINQGGVSQKGVQKSGYKQGFYNHVKGAFVFFHRSAVDD